MKLLQELRAAGLGQDMQAIVDRIPYAKFLGLGIQMDAEQVVSVLPFADHLVGNINLPAIHGGVVGAMLEMTAVLQLIHDTACESLPKTVDVSFDYLRSATNKTTYGRADVTRRGRRVANVRMTLYQDDQSRPVAVGHGHFLLAPTSPPAP